MNDSRRDFLKKAAILAGAAGLPNVVPMSIQKAMAINPATGSTYLDAEHVVILMQENRSFDHCFGTLKGVRGYNDPRAIDLPNKNKVWLQSNEKGETYAPFRLDIKNTKATWMSYLPHTWDNQVNARNNGKYDEWLKVKRSHDIKYADIPFTLGYYTREDIPFYYSFADAFTVCDQHFCSSLTGTSPNRSYLWSGTLREKKDDVSKANVWNEDMDYGNLSWTTFPERLEDHGISWKVYQNELSLDVGWDGEEEGWLSNFGDNNLEFFKQFNVKQHPQYTANLAKKIVKLNDEIEKLKNTQLTEATTAELSKKQETLKKLTADQSQFNQVNFDKLTEREKNLHKKAFTTNINHPDYRSISTLKYDDNGTPREVKMPKGDILHQFRKDVNDRKLPTVSWLAAPEHFSDHPASAWYGAWYVSEVLDILTKNEDVWKKTIFILTYDENDGYFDHCPPFVAPHSHKTGTGAVSQGIDTRPEFVTPEQEKTRKHSPKNRSDNPIGLGYRVPMVVASPWSRGGWVNSEVFDHTSSLQFLETFLAKKTGKQIYDDNISDWRRTVCGDMTSIFRPYHGESFKLPKPEQQTEILKTLHKARFKNLPADFRALSKEEISQINTNPAASALMASQEKGIKPSNALPYELYVDGRFNANTQTFDVKFKAGKNIFDKQAAGVPFNIYAPGKYLKSSDKATPEYENVRTWAYAVKAGDEIKDTWPLAAFEDNKYHLRAYGPNGFYREFKGDASDPRGVDIKCIYEADTRASNLLTGNIQMVITAPDNCEVLITDLSYHQKPVQTTIAKSKTLTLNLQASYSWYDFSVQLKGHNAYSRRYAGKVETGKPTYTDPLMGRVI